MNKQDTKKTFLDFSSFCYLKKISSQLVEIYKIIRLTHQVNYQTFDIGQLHSYVDRARHSATITRREAYRKNI